MASLQLACRIVCWGLVLASVIGFWLITFVRPTRWYRDTPAHSKFFTSWNMPYHGSEVTVGYEAAFLYGLWNAQIVFQWLPNVSAAIFAAALMVINAHRRRQKAYEQHGPLGDKPSSLAASLRVWSKRVLSYQLPPRTFWSSWCGGMSVLDCLLVLFYLGLNTCWLYETYKRTFKSVDLLVDQGELSGREATQAYTAEAGSTWGWVSVVNLLVLFYPVSRSSFLHWITGTDFPVLIRYHRWMSHGTMWVLLMHTLLFYAVWWDRGVWVQETFHWNRYVINNLAGSIAWVISLAIWFCSLSWVRRKYWELFYNVHVYGVPLFLIFSLMHYKYLVYYMLPGLVLYLLDLTFRLWQLNTDKSMATVTAVSDNIVCIELFFAPNVEIAPASFVYLHLHTITQLQRHPFTIAEVHRDAETGAQRAVIYVKAMDTTGWTAQLLRAAQRSKGQVAHLPVTIDGPYGGGNALGDRHLDKAVLVAGGIGATPVISVLLDLVRRRSAGQRVPSSLLLVWAAKSPSEVEAVMPQEVKEAVGGGWLDLALYITGTADKDSCDVTTQKATWGSKGAATSVPSTGLLRGGYDRSYVTYAVGAVLAFFGAYAGMLPAAAYDAHETETTTTGAIYCAVGVIQFFGIAAGVMVPVLLLVVLPSHWYRLYQSRQPSTSDNGHTADTTHATEGGKLLASALSGRPDLQVILGEAQAACQGSALEVPVVVAGPMSMVNAVRDACHRLNTPGSPFLDVQQHTFVL